ncbi:acetolactate synthase large subunit [Corynebacterium pseudokroppenstedtii]|uniref:Acetolactate synthase n=1 Tax=Corynebacterium pseudokroppenstedtii TaxID=2804917 RepID=A0AAU0PVF4_9CORY|nr:acetolactate synthase large subunit [Corynebacterium pseudokroppenstedtii]QRP13689.1 acetolactate synthase large subunit [Corynebacterium kroppenstedtii]MBY0789822.1 acetolactate synthase large subunit [Corynebacterium pseudokroppenstedtii]MCF6793692.1 acetolactate synthase large subunit [Corynebacterium pseudokroppenstedtii]MCF8703120.1 acetolactate synthase large subunit [Corynebacterium pseudokroppenstedtii]MCG2636634.1 acetolactate synthase large subunit [Corynebacterium pseudokroppenst
MNAPSQPPTPATVAASTVATQSGAPNKPTQKIRKEKFTGAELIVRTLEVLGTRTVFGLPGGAVLPLYEALYESTILNHILVRHEQGAGHAATGYAQATGEVGVCIATSGPGATNLVTPLADANIDSVPVVAITGQVGLHLLGTDAFQEADICGVTLPVTKHNFMVTKVEDIPRLIAEAFHLASTGRPGPVLVDVPKDIQNQVAEFEWPVELELPGYRPTTSPHSRKIKQAVDLIAQSRRPVLYVGGGVIKANASAELAEFVEKTGIPVVTTLMALGSFPDSHPLHMGMPGMHGSVSAVASLQKADVVIAIGTRFDDRVTGDVESFAPEAKFIHADIDPAEIGKIREVEVPIVGDAREVLQSLTDMYEKKNLKQPECSRWVDYLHSLQKTYALGWENPDDGKLAPQAVIKAISDEVGPDAIYCAGVGQHQMWAAQFVDYEQPRTWLNSGGLGTMGYAVPAAMGAQAGSPGKEVWAIDGDGCFQMTNQELVTCAVNDLPIKVAVINNGNLGMVRQWQNLFYQSHYSHTGLHPKGEYLPDFVSLAESMGCASFRVTREDEIVPTIKKAREINDRPVVIDFIVGEDAQVWPMVASGHSNDEIQYALNLRPLFDSDQMIDEDSVTDVSDVIEEDQARVAAEGTTAATDDQRGGGEE